KNIQTRVANASGWSPALSQRRCACGRSAMTRRLFVGIGELDQITIVVGSSNKANARREVVARESGGDDDGRNVDQKSVEVRRTFLVDEGWVDPVLDQRR